MRNYELTDDEYSTVMDALNHAEDDAVHSDGEAAFRLLRAELASQHMEQEPHKAGDGQ